MKRIIVFSKYNTLALVLSLVVTSILVGVTVFKGGFNLGIDFRSGQNIVVSVPSAVSSTDVSQALRETFPKVLVTQVNNASDLTFNIKIASKENEQEQQFKHLQGILTSRFKSVEVLSSAFIAGTISRNLLSSSLFLTSIAILLILVYLGIRFKFRFALAAIAALLHDTLFVLSFIGAFHIEVSVSTVAAVLTIVGYSLNDTIVIFDRIRENISFMKGASLRAITDTSITSTLSRTVITSLTTILAVVALYIFATGNVQIFALTLLVGLIEGVWSSVFIATPMLYVFRGKKLVNVFDESTGSSYHEVTKSIHEDTDGQVRTPLSSSASFPITTRAEKIRQQILNRKRRKNK